MLELNQQGIDIFEVIDQALQQAKQVEELNKKTVDLEIQLREQKLDLEKKIDELTSEVASQGETIGGQESLIEQLNDQIAQFDEENLVIKARPEVIEAFDDLANAYMSQGDNKTEEGVVCRILGEFLTSLPKHVPDSLRHNTPFRRLIQELRKQ